MAAPEPRFRQPKQLDAGGLQPEISSFRLHLAAEGKAVQDGDGPTPRRCSGSPPPICAGRSEPPGWEEVRKRDLREWIAWLLDRYSAAYAQ